MSGNLSVEKAEVPQLDTSDLRFITHMDEGSLWKSRVTLQIYLYKCNLMWIKKTKQNQNTKKNLEYKTKSRCL